MTENENTWDKLLKIKTTGRDDSRADQYCYPYEPTPYLGPPKGRTCPLVVFFYCKRKVNELFPPLVRYRCSVFITPAFFKSAIALFTVDLDSFISSAMVGIAGQHTPSLFALSSK